MIWLCLVMIRILPTQTSMGSLWKGPLQTLRIREGCDRWLIVSGNIWNHPAFDTEKNSESSRNYSDYNWNSHIFNCYTFLSITSGGWYRFRFSNSCIIGNPYCNDFTYWICFDNKYKRWQRLQIFTAGFGLI